MVGLSFVSLDSRYPLVCQRACACALSGFIVRRCVQASLQPIGAGSHNTVRHYVTLCAPFKRTGLLYLSAMLGVCTNSRQFCTSCATLATVCTCQPLSEPTDTAAGCLCTQGTSCATLANVCTCQPLSEPTDTAAGCLPLLTWSRSAKPCDGCLRQSAPVC